MNKTTGWILGLASFALVGYGIKVWYDFNRVGIVAIASIIEPALNKVRDGHLMTDLTDAADMALIYTTTTIGKAFEGTFQNSKWETGQTAKGATIVNFTGTILDDKAFEEKFTNAGTCRATLKAAMDSEKISLPEVMEAEQQKRIGLGSDTKLEKTLAPLHTNYQKCLAAAKPLTVKFQFMFTDKGIFLSGIDAGPWGLNLEELKVKDYDEIMRFIYR